MILQDTNKLTQDSYISIMPLQKNAWSTGREDQAWQVAGRQFFTQEVCHWVGSMVWRFFCST